MKRLIGFAILTLTILSTLSFQQKEKLEQTLADKKFSNFVEAVGGEYSYAYYVVLIVKDLNTGESKEICTNASNIIPALKYELNLPNDSIGRAQALKFIKTKRDLKFQFRNPNALKEISFPSYSSKSIEEIKEKYDFEDYIKDIKENKVFIINLPEMEVIPFAHIFFNKGYLLYENACFGHNLIYTEPTETVD